MHKIAKRRKPCTDANVIKDCMMEAENDMCPDKSALFGTISLSASLIVPRTWGEHSFTEMQKAGNLLWYSLALGESTDLSSTSQFSCSFVVLIRTFISHTIYYRFAACIEQ